MKRLSIFSSIVALAFLFSACNKDIPNQNADEGVEVGVKKQTVENGIVWNGDVDKKVAQEVVPYVQNDTRKNASGPKITSNAHSEDFPGIYFIWDSKQKDNGYLKIAATLLDGDGADFLGYESLTLTTKESNTYWDFTISKEEGQQKTADDCYVFYIPKVYNNKNINMVFISVGKLNGGDESVPVQVNITFFIVAPQDKSHADYWNNPFYSQTVTLGKGIDWDAVWAAYAKYYAQDYWGFADFSLAVVPPGGKVDAESVESWRLNVPGKGGVPLSPDEATAWTYTDAYTNAQGVLYFAPIVPKTAKTGTGYFFNPCDKPNTPVIFELELTEGVVPNWEFIISEYAKVGIDINKTGIQNHKGFTIFVDDPIPFQDVVMDTEYNGIGVSTGFWFGQYPYLSPKTDCTPAVEPVVVNLGFIGYYLNDGNVLSTSIHWQDLKEGDMIDWDAVDAAYADWVAKGGLAPKRDTWQTSGYASFTFDDYAAIGFGDFNIGQIESYYKAYFVDPGYVLDPVVNVNFPGLTVVVRCYSTVPAPGSWETKGTYTDAAQLKLAPGTYSIQVQFNSQGSGAASTYSEWITVTNKDVTVDVPVGQITVTGIPEGYRIGLGQEDWVYRVGDYGTDVTFNFIANDDPYKIAVYDGSTLLYEKEVAIGETVAITK